MARTVKSAIALVASAALLTACNWGQPGFSGDNQNSNPAVHNFGPAEAATLHEVWHRAYSDPPMGPAESPGGLVHVSISPEHYQYATVEGIDQRSGTRTWYHAVDLIIPEWVHLLPPVLIEGKLYVGLVGIHQADDGALYDPATGAVLEDPVRWGEATVRGSMRVRLYQRSVTDSLTNDFDIVDMSGDGKGWSPISYGSTGADAPVISTSAVYAYVWSTAAHRGVLGRFAYPLPEDDTPSDPFEGGAATQCTRDSITAALSGEGYVCDPLVNTPIVGSAPVLSSDQRTVYVTSSTTVYALDADTLETKWTVPVPGGIVGPVTVAGGTMYVATGDSLVATPASGCGSATCPPTWSTSLAGGAVSRPTVAGGVAYVVSRPADGSGGDVLQAFDAGCSSGCAPLRSLRTGLVVTGSPVVTTRSRVYLTGTAVGIDPSVDEGRLVAYGPS